MNFENKFSQEIYKKMYQEILQDLSSLWTVAVRERDEASERLQNSLAELSRLHKIFNSIMLSEEGQVLPHYYYPESIEETYRLQNCNYNNHYSSDSPSRFSFASPLDFVSNPIGNSSPAISDSGSYSSSSSNQNGIVVQNRRDFESFVLEMIGGQLPENGKFRQAVVEAGPLLESLFITGPIPKWRNPPVQRPVLSNKWNSGGLEFGSGILNRYFPCKKPRFSLSSA